LVKLQSDAKWVEKRVSSLAAEQAERTDVAETLFDDGQDVKIS